MANQQGDGGEGHGGIYAILIIIVILILAAVLYLSGAFGGRTGGEEGIDADIEIQVPATPGQE